MLDGKDVMEFDGDTVLVLPKERCLPVVQGLMALLLGMDFTCNVDLFLVTCKVRPEFFYKLNYKPSYCNFL